MTSRKRTSTARRRNRRGILAFEWILLVSLLVIGIIGGLSVVRDAICSELQDLAECIQSLNVCSKDDGDTGPDITDPSNLPFP